jgi:lipid II:glycine glycyltransferase (peptidoglycan interpeptide bridge formation enzyme)
MPQCEILYDITKTDTQLLAEMNSWAKERIKKWIHKGVIFERLEPEDYERFYQHWLEMAWGKWFNIIPYDQFTRLASYIREHKAGDLFISRIDDKILAWSVCLFDKTRIIYYLGFANRDKNLRNIGGHAYLKFEIMRRAREKWFTLVDMMGGAPTGFDDHPLAGVTQFKESLWGMKIEEYGSYDIVVNPWLYKLFEWYTNWRH